MTVNVGRGGGVIKNGDSNDTALLIHVFFTSRKLAVYDNLKKKCLCSCIFVDYLSQKLVPCFAGDCVVCFEEKREVVIDPCGHFGLCKKCSQILRKCPICRCKINKGLTVFTM